MLKATDPNKPFKQTNQLVSSLKSHKKYKTKVASTLISGKEVALHITETLTSVRKANV